MDTLTFSCFIQDGNYHHHKSIKITIEQLRSIIEEELRCDDNRILESFSLDKIE